jgi:hypothetical protein
MLKEIPSIRINMRNLQNLMSQNQMAHSYIYFIRKNFISAPNSLEIYLPIFCAGNIFCGAFPIMLILITECELIPLDVTAMNLNSSLLLDVASHNRRFDGTCSSIIRAMLLD